MTVGSQFKAPVYGCGMNRGSSRGCCSHCAHSREAERQECGCSACLQSRTPDHEMMLPTLRLHAPPKLKEETFSQTCLKDCSLGSSNSVKLITNMNHHRHQGKYIGILLLDYHHTIVQKMYIYSQNFYFIWCVCMCAHVKVRENFRRCFSPSIVGSGNWTCVVSLVCQVLLPTKSFCWPKIMSFQINIL